MCAFFVFLILNDTGCRRYLHDLLGAGTPSGKKESFLTACNHQNTSTFRPLPLSFLKFNNRTASKNKQTNEENCTVCWLTIASLTRSFKTFTNGKNKTVTAGCGEIRFSPNYPLITVEWHDPMWWKFRILSVSLLERTISQSDEKSVFLRIGTKKLNLF